MRRLVLVVLLSAACRERLVGIASELTLEAFAVDFPATAVGDTRLRSLRLTNASAAPLALRARAAAPFALERDVDLAGGASLLLELGFSPAAQGTFEGTLQLDGDTSASVRLTGEAVAAAQCADPSPCRASSRDVASNTCVEESRPDGTVCAADNACLGGGRCLAGACIGSPLSCEDRDACTVDACEPVGGCAHFALQCPKPADPCQVARCDSSSGCGTVAAADGTLCGPSDCITAQVCLSGACRALPVPDGFACGEQTPCRPRGRCSAGACTQAPASRLAELWHRDLPQDTQFLGVTDAAGNLYRLECDGTRSVTPCALVSDTPAGFERLRVWLGALSTTLGATHFALGGRLYVVSEAGAVEALSEVSGGRLWLSGGLGERLIAAVADLRGQVHVAVSGRGGWAIHTLDGASGAPLRSLTLSGPVASLTLDEHDNLYFDVRDTERPLGAPSLDGGSPAVPAGAGARFHLVSLTASSAVRYVVPQNGPDAPVAAFNGELLQASGTLRKTLDGSVIGAQRGWGWADGWLPAPLMSPASRYWWEGSGCCPTCDCADLYALGGVRLLGAPAGSGAVSFSWESVGARPSEPLLLGDGSALLASESPATHDVELRALDATGAQRFACVVDTALVGGESLRSFTGGAALTQGRWAVLERVACPYCRRAPEPVLKVYQVPGLFAAPQGWSGPGGAPGRRGGPR